MIPSDLKVGDTYLEGDLIYRVTKVVGNGVYEGTWTGKTLSATPEEPAAEEVKEEVKKPDYMSMQYATLKKMCAEKGLDARGTKADLIARLEG